MRNYNRLRRGRVEQSIQDAGLAGHIVVAERAFDENGRQLPGKIAVYARCQHTAALFFQFYANLKADEKRTSELVERVLAEHA